MYTYPAWLPTFLNDFNACVSESQIEKVKINYLDRDFPAVPHYLSNWYKRHGDTETAHSIIRMGLAKYLIYFKGLETSDAWNSPFIESVGQMLGMLYSEFTHLEYPTDIKVKLLEMSYLYLLRQAEQFPDRSPDTFYTAAIVLSQSRDLTTRLVLNNRDAIGPAINVDVLTLSNWYFASVAFNNLGNAQAAIKAKQKAELIHQQLDDLTIAGKDADEYSLGEIAQIGYRRNMLIFSTLFNRFKKLELFLTQQEI